MMKWPVLVGRVAFFLWMQLAMRAMNGRLLHSEYQLVRNVCGMRTDDMNVMDSAFFCQSCLQYRRGG
jgi:hypothetical protein